MHINTHTITRAAARAHTDSSLGFASYPDLLEICDFPRKVSHEAESHGEPCVGVGVGVGVGVCVCAWACGHAAQVWVCIRVRALAHTHIPCVTMTILSKRCRFELSVNLIVHVCGYVREHVHKCKHVRVRARARECECACVRAGVRVNMFFGLSVTPKQSLEE